MARADSWEKLCAKQRYLLFKKARALFLFTKYKIWCIESSLFSHCQRQSDMLFYRAYKNIYGTTLIYTHTNINTGTFLNSKWYEHKFVFVFLCFKGNHTTMQKRKDISMMSIYTTLVYFFLDFVLIHPSSVFICQTTYSRKGVRVTTEIRRLSGGSSILTL